MITVINNIFEGNMELIMLFLLFISCSSVERIEGTEVGDCTDGADNDMDGFFDCSDSSYKGSSDCDQTTNNTYEDEEEDDDDENSCYDPSLIGNPESGEVLYERNCSECRVSDGMGGIGPSIVEEVWEEDDEEIWEVIFEGEDGMPPFTLMPQEVADIVTWLRFQFS